MNLFERFLYLLQGEMKEPSAFGWFHWLCITIMLLILIWLFIIKKKNNDRQLKMVLGIYGIGALILEILKQLIWSFNYDAITGIAIWGYQWYAFPFQLCTTPIFVCIICLFLKKGKIRDSLLSYMSFVTILGSLSTILLPDTCLVKDILVNIHTMYLHMGSFIVSVYLIMIDEVKLNLKNFINSIIVFLIFLGIAEILNLIMYNTNIIHSETFNMFYISPYFISSLPIFDTIQENVPYIIYLAIYISVIVIGSLIIFGIFKLLKFIIKKLIK